MQWAGQSIYMEEGVFTIDWKFSENGCEPVLYYFEVTILLVELSGSDI